MQPMFVASSIMLFAASEVAPIHPAGWVMIILAGVFVFGVSGLIIHSWWSNRPPNLNDPLQMLNHHVGVLMYHDTRTLEFKPAVQKFAELSRDIVPDSGQASTVQGEVVRCVDRLASEDRRNGNLNWGDYYQAMADFLKVHLVDNSPFAEPLQTQVASDLALVTRHGTHEQDPEEVRLAFGRLIMAAVLFNEYNEVPIELPSDGRDDFN